LDHCNERSGIEWDRVRRCLGVGLGKTISSDVLGSAFLCITDCRYQRRHERFSKRKPSLMFLLHFVKTIHTIAKKKAGSV
jgi:hypothetical protein